MFSPEETFLKRSLPIKLRRFGIAREAKQNLQADRSLDERQALDEALSAALCQDRQLQMFAYPKRILAATWPARDCCVDGWWLSKPTRFVPGR